MMTTDLEYLNRINAMIAQMQEINETLGAIVQDALKNKKQGLRSTAYEFSKSIQLKEDDVMEMCVGSIIRYQPFASDLRAVTVAMKLSYDLSRVCRYMYNIVETLDEFDVKSCDVREVSALLDDAREMVQQSLKAYFERDSKKAAEIIKSDDSIDQRYRMILSMHKTKPACESECILFNGLTARIIERLADHACYISSEVIYLVSGRRTDYR